MDNVGNSSFLIKIILFNMLNDMILNKNVLLHVIKI